ncbi:hypothetical protein [Pontibacter chitinilyticus]|uniref:hypothetical protein n=1 Tax=Pontibacter chitinilyticus TaxID=2674989 RepID=UPI00321BD9A2
MRNIVRTLFGWNRSTGSRTVAGSPASVDVKDVSYIRNSNARLKTLQNLYIRYKATPHAPKLKAAYDKTKAIHTYLVDRQRVHELEMFHLQHTDHFISTFTAIIDMHRHQEAQAPEPPPVKEIPQEKRMKAQPVYPLPRRETLSETIFKRIETEAEGILRKIETEVARSNGRVPSIPDIVKRAVRPEPFGTTVASPQEQEVVVPAISVDTFAKVFYVREQTSNGVLSGEISYTSSEQEKNAFLHTVSARLGLAKGTLSYVGNALLRLPDNNGTSQSGYVPVLHWNGCAYALHLSDYRLFPVKMHRRSY